MIKEIDYEVQQFRESVVLNSIRQVWIFKQDTTSKSKLIIEMCKSWGIDKITATEILQRLIDIKKIKEDNGELWL